MRQFFRSCRTRLARNLRRLKGTWRLLKLAVKLYRQQAQDAKFAGIKASRADLERRDRILAELARLSPHPPNCAPKLNVKWKRATTRKRGARS